MATKFFEEEKEELEQPEKIKLGETEFTQEELNELVGAGRKLKQIETKQGQPIDDILKSWGKRGERLGEWKKVTGAKKPDEFIAKVEAEKVKTPEQVDREQIKAKVLEEAREFGLLTVDEIQKAGFLTREDYDKIESGKKTLSEVRRTIKKNIKSGFPEVSETDLLTFMSDPKNPADAQNAYDLMFKDKIREIEMEKLNSLKKKPIYTTSGSTAGSKQFNPARPSTRESLRDVMRQHFNQER